MMTRTSTLCFSLSLFLQNCNIVQSAFIGNLGGSTRVASTVRVSIEKNSISTDDKLWWKDFELQDPSLPESVRADFPILTQTLPIEEGEEEEEPTPILYLDSAATSQKPRQVLDALTSYYETANSNVHRGAHALSRRATSAYEEARDTVASFINAYHRNEIVFTSGATEAINLVAYSLTGDMQPGDEIIISELEHHSNIVPWQILKERKGVVLKFVPVDKSTGGYDLNVLEKLLGPKTKVVSLQHVSNVMGCFHPLHIITPLIRSKAPSAKILIDACQSVPHMAVDVQSLDIDFLAASGHKMCGPTGIGFLWGKQSLLDNMEPFMGGGEMIQEVFLDRSTYAPSPSRFEAGTPPIAQAVGLGRAIRYLSDIGMERIHNYEVEIGTYMYKRLQNLEGVTILGPDATREERASLAAFVCEDVHPSDLSTFLDMEGVAIRAGHHCCQPLHRALGYSHSARASLYFYNTKEEVDVFIEKLEDTLSFLRSMNR